MTLAEKKSALRKNALADRKELCGKYISSASLKISEQLIDLALKAQADTVLLFYPIKNEPDLLCSVNKLRAHGITVGFPISVTETLTLDFRAVSDISDMSLGAYGIREPMQNAQKIKTTKHTLCAVPALAFDKDGYRLGYGKGYYDRFLSDFDGTSVGVTYKDFILDTLPRGEFDLSVDLIITEGGVTLPNEAAKKNIHPEKSSEG